MSAAVCGKRSNFFEESSSSPPSSKRIRCSSFSPPRTLASSLLVDHLSALFPGMDRQFLEKALEESGDDLDSAIKRLNELCLSAGSSTSDLTKGIDDHLSVKGTEANNDVAGAKEEANTVRNPINGADWIELLVGEVVNASNIDDAKLRVAQALQSLEKSIYANATLEAAQTFQKENTVLKQQVDLLSQDNAILKRAVAIQHERQKEYEESGQELNQLKQLVSQYQEQVRTLEVNNYALAMHLKQAQQSNSLPPGRYNPDVF